MQLHDQIYKKNNITNPFPISIPSYKTRVNILDNFIAKISQFFYSADPVDLETTICNETQLNNLTYKINF